METPLTQRTKHERLAFSRHDVVEARFVDTARSTLLEKLSILTIGDLLWHAPFRYLDFRIDQPIGRARIGEGAFLGVIRDITVKRPRPKLNVTEVTITDGTGTLVGVWFNQPWVSRSYVEGERVIFAGDLKMSYGIKQISQPLVEKLGQDEEATSRILPVYHTTEGLSMGWLRRLIGAAIDDVAESVDILPYSLRSKHKLPSFASAVKGLHFPHFDGESARARRRLAYQEFFMFELIAARRRHVQTREKVGFSHTIDGPLQAAAAQAMGFRLTDEQQAAVKDILGDMRSAHPMHRILIGDVGTGKTAVALHALAAAADSSTQAVMMAPTEVLARQYAAKVGPILTTAGIPWGILTGSTKKSERDRLLTSTADGSIAILFGTHALLEPDVDFKNLTLAIIDEQHRFGVKQRKTLSEKGKATDVLIMTATPIPRTLAQTAYGDLAVSYIRKRPIEGAGITTQLIKHHQIYKTHAAVREAVAKGQRAYVVCALVDDSDSLSAKAAMRTAENLKKNEYSDLRVELLTGRTPSTEKAEVMQRFADGEIDVLVATTVIEVGVDVKDATVMVILDAERFGVAQLHQLRGRVGRGNTPGHVFLVSDSFSDEAKERFNILLATDDGFELAEFDLRTRGPGEVLGLRQHGLLDFKVANIMTDSDILDVARSDAFEIISKDPKLSEPIHALLRQEVERIEQSALNWIVAG